MFQRFLALRSPRLAYVLLSLATLSWAGNAIVGRALHASIPPVSFAFWRWLLAAVLLAPFAWRLFWRDLRSMLGVWPVMLALAFFGIACFNTLLYTAAQTTTATNIALIQTAMPAVIVLLGRLFYGERVSHRGALGVALSMLGAVVIVMRGNPQALAQLHFVAGDLWMLLAVVLYALYSVLLRLRPAVHPLSLLQAIFVLGTLMLLPLYLHQPAGSVGAVSTQWGPGVIGGILYVAVFPSILAYLFWNRGVELLGSSRAGLFICLVPVFAAVLAMVFLHERLHAFHIYGLLLIIGGFLLFHRQEPDAPT